MVSFNLFTAAKPCAPGMLSRDKCAGSTSKQEVLKTSNSNKTSAENYDGRSKHAALLPNLSRTQRHRDEIFSVLEPNLTSGIYRQRSSPSLHGVSN